MKNIIGGKPGPATSQARTGSDAQAVRHLTVDESGAGQRLDNFLFRSLKGVPKTHVYRIIRSGEVRVNKGRAQAETRVEEGDLVRLPPMRVSARSTEVAPAAPAREFALLHEDDALLAVDKPCGVAVHGGSGVSFGVIEQLRSARPAARFLELVHRLDKETSGILLVAKKRSALTNLQEQFRERETGKVYLALVVGDWPDNKKVLDASLARYLVAGAADGKAEGERRVRVVAKDHPDAMRAVTLVRVVARTKLGDEALPLSLLAVTIKTGRTHQIRVHLASAGHPIAGDEKYGDFALNRALQKAGLKRMFLHAWRLRFTHPVSGETMKLQAVLPSELATLLDPAILTDIYASA
ncbi:RluA family pseudouridine synthase [Variovorax dokdonensis]|uniref:RluA family pseudouridine synthase n=1 Tax=Variovorax dokdonensis TaxID=344883 RepID=UPI0036439032